MKKSLLELIVCSLCKGVLRCDSFALSTSGEWQSGLLTCTACGTTYPLIGGIPRLLPPALQGMLRETNQDFFRQYKDRLPSLPHGAQVTNSDAALSAQLDTAKSFGYEWQAFSEMLPDYEANFRWYFERFQPAQFAGKRVLDAGCGTGRHAYYMAEGGAREVVAMDFSQAIEVAAYNNRKHANMHFVQADIYHPPFLPETFDFLYSHGVLHHLPDPERGFRMLLPLLRAGEFLNLFLYWNLEDEAAWKRFLLKGVTQARRITTHLPHRLLQPLSWLVAVGFQTAFVLPARALDVLPATRSFADRVPLGHYRKYSFRVLYTDQFDRLSAPIENRYSRAEVAGWFARAGLTDVIILGGQGWRASGRRGKVAATGKRDSTA